MATKSMIAKTRFTPCQRGDSLLQNFPGATSGAAPRDAFGFHPSVHASNFIETVDFRVLAIAEK